jgi:hypothetical protein
MERIIVPDQPWKEVPETPSQPIPRCDGMCLSSLFTREAEIEDAVPGQPRQKEFARSHLNGKKLGVVACTCHPRTSRKLKIGGWQSRLAWAKSKTLSLQQPGQKGLVECLKW